MWRQQGNVIRESGVAKLRVLTTICVNIHHVLCDVLKVPERYNLSDEYCYFDGQGTWNSYFLLFLGNCSYSRSIEFI